MGQHDGKLISGKPESHIVSPDYPNDLISYILQQGIPAVVTISVVYRF